MRVRLQAKATWRVTENGSMHVLLSLCGSSGVTQQIRSSGGTQKHLLIEGVAEGRLVHFWQAWTSILVLLQRLPVERVDASNSNRSCIGSHASKACVYFVRICTLLVLDAAFEAQCQQIACRAWWTFQTARCASRRDMWLWQDDSRLWRDVRDQVYRDERDAMCSNADVPASGCSALVFSANSRLLATSRKRPSVLTGRALQAGSYSPRPHQVTSQGCNVPFPDGSGSRIWND